MSIFHFYSHCKKIKIFGKIIIFLLLFSPATFVFAQETLQFAGVCNKQDSINIAAVGDVLLHHPLQEKASKFGYNSLWQAALPYLNQADITYANLEGPIAQGLTVAGPVTATKEWDWKVYSDYPLFNYHPSLAKDLIKSGVDIVSTANNHALDRQGIGIDKTIGVLKNSGLAFCGTREKNSQQSFVTFTKKNNFNIAWIACTEHTNGNEDRYKQVLYCYKEADKKWILNTIQSLKDKVDAVVVTPHFGAEYEQQPNHAQRQFAHQVLDAGALIVIGSHPHVLQPMEKYKTKDGREAFIMYSMGNFVSFQGSPMKRATIVLLIGLTKNGNHAVINNVKYVPMYMQNRGGVSKIKLQQIQEKDAANEGYQVINALLPTGNSVYSTQETSMKCLN